MISGGSGSIEVITGPMFSGKSEELIRRLRRASIARLRVQVFKHRIDTRYSCEHIASHSEWRLPAELVGSAEDIGAKLERGAAVVGIDEAQFFPADLVPAIVRMANEGIRVVAAGLNLDFLGRPFGVMPDLLAVADRVTKLTAICAACGAEAYFTHRISASTEPVCIGAGETYEARCRRCFLLGSGTGAGVAGPSLGNPFAKS